MDSEERLDSRLVGFISSIWCFKHIPSYILLEKGIFLSNGLFEL